MPFTQYTPIHAIVSLSSTLLDPTVIFFDKSDNVLACETSLEGIFGTDHLIDALRACLSHHNSSLAEAVPVSPGRQPGHPANAWKDPVVIHIRPTADEAAFVNQQPRREDVFPASFLRQVIPAADAERFAGARLGAGSPTPEQPLPLLRLCDLPAVAKAFSPFADSLGCPLGASKLTSYSDLCRTASSRGRGSPSPRGLCTILEDPSPSPERLFERRVETVVTAADPEEFYPQEMTVQCTAGGLPRRTWYGPRREVDPRRLATVARASRTQFLPPVGKVSLQILYIMAKTRASKGE